MAQMDRVDSMVKTGDLEAVVGGVETEVRGARLEMSLLVG